MKKEKKSNKNVHKNINCKYKAIIFDLDGTLINSMSYHFMAFKETLKEHGINMKDATLKNFMGGSTRKILQAIKNVYNFPGKIEDIREERRYHYFRLLGNKNIIFPGIESLIKELKENYKLGIATGSSRVTVRYSINKNFQNMFDFIATINDVRRGKPFPDQLILVAKKLRVKPFECLMVGDSSYDGLAARAAGMDFLGVTTGYTSAKELKKNGAAMVLSGVKDINNYLKDNLNDK